MKILFLDDRSPKVGSTRIWVHNLSQWLFEVGCDTALNDTQNLADYDVVVLGKGPQYLPWVDKVRAANPGALIGWINTSVDPATADPQTLARDAEVDFLIVGSIEERDYRRRHKRHVLIFPLIERLYTRQKQHRDRSPIVLGYHGNTAHLVEFAPHATAAINEVSREFDLKLVAVHGGPTDLDWQVGRPEIPVEHRLWDFDTVEQTLLGCDIGLVPYMSPLSAEGRRRVLDAWEMPTDGQASATDEDYLLRVKVNANAGRAFVFHQLNIPVIADFAPSHFHVMGDVRCGYLAHHREGWADALRALCGSAEHRQRVADAARQRFEQLYNPHDWAALLCEQIESLGRSKRPG